MTPPSLRDALEQAILLSVGAASLTRDRVEHIVGELVAQGRVSAEDGRVLMERLIARVVDPQRPAPSGVIGHLEESLRGALADAGVLTRNEVDDLRVHVAEIDHRLRLLEGASEPAPAVDETPASDVAAEPAE
jgi:polyhydroxyalkanoate synthesis regulator phasin